MVSLMSILNMFGVLGAAPTIDPVGEWISREGGTGVGIIVFVVGLLVSMAEWLRCYLLVD